MNKTIFTAVLVLSAVTGLCSSDTAAREIHVATTGADTGNGSADEPLLTIQHAAQMAQPGDTITVHAGIYREQVAPPRGGLADDQRIVFQAAAGDRVAIRGSEVVNTWQRVSGGTWRAVLPNRFFGEFNPYSDAIHGDWFNPRGRVHHTGAVYLDGHWLTEAAKKEDVLKPIGQTPLWFAAVDSEQTTIWAQFGDTNPNQGNVEINVRQAVIYPPTTGINYITVRGFVLEHAATPWAPPTAEQIGLIGTRWSKGWIIENNVVRYSTCVGIALGKYGDQWDNTSQNTATGYVKTIERGLANGWNGDTVGHHIVRHNRISHCEQAGVVGSLGCIFCQVTDNDISDIWARRLFSGAEMAGIKFHGAVDTLIARNHIHNAGRGMWMDWMAQGTRISSNLCYDNTTDDFFAEVDHGPFLVDNNIFLSPAPIRSMSEGGAFVHNLIRGKISVRPETRRDTPHLKAHSTAVAGLCQTLGGDDRYYNNVFIGSTGLNVYAKAHYPCFVDGNVYLAGALPSRFDRHAAQLPDADPDLQLVTENGNVFLSLIWPQLEAGQQRRLVTTQLLGKTAVGKLPYVNADDSSLRIDRDYFGHSRRSAEPSPGPFTHLKAGQQRIRVWPRSDRGR